MIRVLGLLGSPRRHGTTERLLARFLAGAEDAGGHVRKIPVVELGIEGWVPELECQDDASRSAADAFQKVSRALVAADVIVVASPVYFRNVPAQLKGLIDRSQCQWLRKYVDREPLSPSAAGHERRRGVLIATGGHDREHFEGTIQTIRSFFDVYEADYWGEVLIAGTDAKEIDDEQLVLQKSYDLGFRAVGEEWV